MTSQKSTYQIFAQAETLLIYGIFLFLTGLTQIAVTIGQRYVIERNKQNGTHINFLNLFPASYSINDIHLWFIYPSAFFTIIPCLCCVIYAIVKRPFTVIFICMSSLISFISSSVYIGLLIIHTLEYWQMISSSRLKSFRTTTASTTIPTIQLLVPFDEPATFVNLALLITFTLALVQALLSLIGAVISCLWSPCCTNPVPTYKPIATNSHYSQTTPHRFDSLHSTPLRNLKRHQPSETHRFIITQDPSDSLINGFIHKSPLIRSNYDDV
ncbi:unnamed protein product [Adineta ricciae]|uniref:Uncharacterized protein n=1 Tax=Adineta ricciae TaxID=249248 RepID=A0A814HAW6_ADIRI|nr:unnamed protein product [Adineta ricciae]CAF1138213.1 unnamed protein product [Adineta ricciae]